MAEDKDYRAHILLLIPSIWLLFFFAADAYHHNVRNNPVVGENWDLKNLSIVDSGGEHVAGLMEVFKLKAVPVNSAGQQLLMTVPGIGPELARRILAQRDSTGRFQAPEDLVKVNGIGSRRAEQFKGYLSFD